MKRSALVIGASRGIGRQIAITLANNSYRVAVAAKTTKETDQLPGTIHSVLKELQGDRDGGHIALECDVRKEEHIQRCVETCLQTFGGLDLVVYNPGAIWWNSVANTPLKRFDLMHEVNLRGGYAVVQTIMPHFLSKKSGKLVVVSPPIYSRFFKGKVAYAITKVGLTVLTMGLSEELKGTGISVSALWPATGIESHVTTVKQFPASMMRKSTIFADACLAIAQESSDKYNGRALLDEDLLRECGVTDFSKYRCDPTAEPPRMMPKKFPDLTVEEQNENLFNSRL